MFRLGMLCVEGPEEMRSDKYAFQFLSYGIRYKPSYFMAEFGKTL